MITVAYLARVVGGGKSRIQCQDSLDPYVQTWNIEGLKHDFRCVLSILRSVQRRLCQNEVVSFRVNSQRPGKHQAHFQGAKTTGFTTARAAAHVTRHKLFYASGSTSWCLSLLVHCVHASHVALCMMIFPSLLCCRHKECARTYLKMHCW